VPTTQRSYSPRSAASVSSRIIRAAAYGPTRVPSRKEPGRWVRIAHGVRCRCEA
jgi:hypothetical protein